MAQAQAADAARKTGARGPLLGIPIAIKNNYDTKDMATTNGSFTFEDFRPATDAFQVARLREAGAVHHRQGRAGGIRHERPLLQRRVGPGVERRSTRRSPRSASSGGSASAVAASLAAAALGSQTGDSLYAPASAQSLVTLRGTDGLQSGTGHHAADLDDRLRRRHDALGLGSRRHAQHRRRHRSRRSGDAAPARRRRSRRTGARCWMSTPSQGKRIGYIPVGRGSIPFGTTGTTDAEKAALQYLEAAGATIVEMGADASATPVHAAGAGGAGLSTGGSIRSEGWRQYIDSHPELHAQGFQIFSEVDVNCSQKKVPYVRAAASACAATPARRLTAAEIQAHRDYRQVTRPAAVKTWMDKPAPTTRRRRRRLSRDC